MPGFPLDEKIIEGGRAAITGTDYRHIVKVLRMKGGDAVTLSDGNSVEYAGRISHVGSGEIMVDIAFSRKIPLSA